MQDIKIIYKGDAAGTTDSSDMRRETTMECCMGGTGTMIRRVSYRWLTTQLTPRQASMQRGNMYLSLLIDDIYDNDRVFSI